MIIYQDKLIYTSVSASIILFLGLLFYRYVFPRKNINLFILLIFISLLPILSIFRPGTYQAGDLTIHSVFLQSFFQNLQDGILIPQWAGGLCGGYGCPVFMFEYVLPFYIGSFFHALGFSLLDSMKLFLASTYILSGITMYIFINDEYGKKEAFVASILYLFAPVRFIEMHFRVSVGTDAAFIFVPLAFYFVKKSLSGKLLYIILCALNFLLLILAHSSITLVTIPASLFYAFIKKKKIKDLVYPIAGYILGAGLVAYYALPAVSEVKYTWTSQAIKSVTDFKPFLEYIYSPSRFGLLFQGNNGELWLIVGYAQLFIVIFAIYSLFKNKYNQEEKKLIIFLLLFFIICFLLMLSLTKPLWDTIFLLRSFVLPWRMLVPITFATAFLGAIVTKDWGRKFLVIFCIIVILLTILNWGNRKMVPLEPHAFYTHWSLYSEYYEPGNPIYVSRYKNRVNKIPNLVLHKPVTHLEILSGKGEVKEIKRTQISHEYLLYAASNLQLSENTYYFTGWKIYVNGKQTPINIRNSKHFGTLTFNLTKGLYDIKAEFQDTPERKIAKIISAMTFIITIITLLFAISRKIDYVNFKKNKLTLKK